MRQLGRATGVLLGAGCTGPQAALDAAGPQARHIGGLWWLFLAVSVAIMIAVVVALALAVVRGRRQHRDGLELAVPIDAGPERTATAAVTVATAFTTLILLGLLLASVVTSRTLAAVAVPQPRTIEVTGHQWWWEITYPDTDPSRRVTTANELHIPVGEAVKVALASRDVIHSFWVPALHGKRDLITGHQTHIWLKADRPGVLEGQCAEFCGLQHARMRLKVFAEEPAQFAAWLEGQRAPGAEPSTPLVQRGRDVFVSGPCALCHTIQGTDARGTVAPDLTHLGSRTTLAAGVLPNTRGHLAGWILDPQSVKPGTQMPASSFDVESLHALLAYLGTLR
jgi:cytochrome c oxidase subunit II